MFQQYDEERSQRVGAWGDLEGSKCCWLLDHIRGRRKVRDGVWKLLGERSLGFRLFSGFAHQ